MTQEKKHTELPWRVSENELGYLNFDILAHKMGYTNVGIARLVHCAFSDPSLGSLALHKDEIISNAHFIVRACNNFYPLLEACKAIEANLEYKRKLAIDRGVSIAYSPIEEKLRQAIKAAEEE